MLSLLKIKGMLDQFSASERKLADFILDNSHLLRDYSSQQLADAVGISQSSVVKFCQKLGYKGYPDLKLAITEAVVTASTLQREQQEQPLELSNIGQLAEQLQQSLWQSLRGLLTINPEQQLQRAVKLLQQTQHVLLAGSAHSAVVAADMQYRLLQLNKLALYCGEPALTLQLAQTLPADAVVLLFSESGDNPDLLQLEALARQRQLKIISFTRFQTNPQSVVADVTLFTLESETSTLLAPLLSQQAQQHLCHLLFLLLAQRPGLR